MSPAERERRLKAGALKRRAHDILGLVGDALWRGMDAEHIEVCAGGSRAAYPAEVAEALNRQYFEELHLELVWDGRRATEGWWVRELEL